MRLLVTGASGELGSHLVPMLVEDGHQVTALIHQRNLPVGVEVPGERCLEGDVTQPGFGIAGKLPALDALVHCAGQVRFRESKSLYLTNVYGVANAIQLALERRVPLFHVSTAYVIGLDPLRRLASADSTPGGFRNAYERGKWDAEVSIRHVKALDYTIVRPSILVGDSQVVGMPPPLGLYQGVKAVATVKRWTERCMGLPPLKPVLRLPGDPQGRINLIPVDLAARQLADLIQANARGSYHLVNEDPPLVEDVIAAVSRVLEADIQVVPDFDPNPAERLLALLLRNLLPYLQGEPVFLNDNIHPLTAARCQGLSGEFIEATTRRFLGVKEVT